MRRYSILWIMLVMVVFGCTVMSGGAEADVAEDPVGKNMTHSVPGPDGSHYLWVLPGDNVTMSIWNYSGTENRSATVDFSFAYFDLYYDRSSNLDADLHAEFQLRTGENYTFWAVAYEPNLMYINLWMFNDYISASYEYRIDRTTSTYTPDYLGGVGEDMRADLESLKNSTRALSEETAALRENNTNIWDNLTTAEEDIGALTVWKSIARLEIKYFFGQLDKINTSLSTLGTSYDNISAQLAVLVTAYEELNDTLTTLTADVEALKALAVDLTWVEENLTEIRSQIAAIETVLEDLPLMEEDIDVLETLVAEVTQDIEALDANLTAVEEGIPAAYDDTALLERIAQLEGQNQLLQQQLADLEDEQDEIKDATPSATIGYVALVLALVGVLIGLAVFMMKRKGEDRLWEEGA